MRLGLSSAAAPEARFGELIGACTRRGLPVLELRAGDGHGVSPAAGIGAAALAAAEAEAAGITIGGYRTGGDDPVDDALLLAFADALGAPLVLDGPDAATRALHLGAAGADVVVALRGDSVEAVAARVYSAGLDLAWDADPRRESVGGRAASLLAQWGTGLRTIRLIGGGPEAALHEGRGVGELMARLALARYAGTLVLAPSSSRFRVAWESWLGHRGGWGCGSRTADPSLVQLGGATINGGLR